MPDGDIQVPGVGVGVDDTGVAVGEAVASTSPGGATAMGVQEGKQFAQDAAAAGVTTRGAAIETQLQPTLSGLIDITGQETTGITAAQSGLPSRSTFSSLITGK
jgi:hypothetical protein